MHHQDWTVSTLFHLRFTGTVSRSGEAIIPRYPWYLCPRIRSGPNSFSFSGLTGGPGLLSLMLGPFKGLSADEDSIFRMQRYASLDSCDGLSHRCHTCTRIWQYEGSTAIENHNVAFVNHSPHCKQRLADLGSSECHSARDVTATVSFGANFCCKFSQIVYIFTSEAHVCCAFTEAFDGFESTFGQSSAFTTDSPAPESTVIYRYRPRSPSVATSLLSMDIWQL